MKDNSISWTEKLNNGTTFVDLGYRDYIAARLLLNNHLIVQGITLASTSVEKYLKAIIAFNLQKKERYNFHLNNYKSLKKLLKKVNNDITEVFDPVFIEILQNAFRIRYYDGIKKPMFMGFFINQFIGELDYSIAFMEKYISDTQKGGKSFSKYSRAMDSNDAHLYENNYILNNEDKKDYMEKPDIGFSIYIRMGSVVQEEKIVKGGSTQNKYEGQISKFTEFNETLFLNNNSR